MEIYTERNNKLNNLSVRLLWFEYDVPLPQKFIYWGLGFQLVVPFWKVLETLGGEA
jgi:hypothetical protein